MSSKERQSNFELLKIIGMFLIIFHHLSEQGLWISPNSDYNFLYILQKATRGWLGWIGNWIFIFSSGYFIANSKFKWKKVFRLWFQVFSISVIVGVIFFITKANTIGWSVKESFSEIGFKAAAPLTIVDLIRCFVPFYSGANWFFCTYVVFYILTPFLNSYLKKIKEDELRKLVITLFCLVIVLQWFPKEHILNFGRLTSVFNFIFGYFLINYIKIYDPKIIKHKGLNITLLIAWCILYPLFIVTLFKFPKLFFGLEEKLYNHTNTMSFQFVPAFLLFCIFKDLNLKPNMIINKIGTTLFGVYIIHFCVPLRYWIQYRVFGIENFYNTYLIIPYMFLITFIVFICSALLEICRKNIIEKPLFKIIDKHWK